MAIWPDYVCRNEQCSSFGKSHPHCECGSPMGRNYSDGGEVDHYCLSKKPHQDSCPHFASGGQVEEQTKFHNDPQHAIGHAALSSGLLGLLTKTGHSKSEDPHRHFEEFHKAYNSGTKALKGHLDNFLGGKNLGLKPDLHSREALKDHLQYLRESPESLLDIGGKLGDSLPQHGAVLAATAGDALNHFNAIKPQQSKARPLDELTPPDQMAQNTYDRHLDLAEHPALILQHVQDGTLLPSDLSALGALYPGLKKSIISQAGESLINAKTDGVKIPYHQRQSLSLLLGQPLDSTMTPMAMQAIISSAAVQQNQSQQKAKPKKASGSELKQINFVNRLSTTSLQDREFDKKD